MCPSHFSNNPRKGAFLMYGGVGLLGNQGEAENELFSPHVFYPDCQSWKGPQHLHWAGQELRCTQDTPRSPGAGAGLGVRPFPGTALPLPHPQAPGLHERLNSTHCEIDFINRKVYPLSSTTVVSLPCCLSSQLNVGWLQIFLQQYTVPERREAISLICICVI